MCKQIFHFKKNIGRRIFIQFEKVYKKSCMDEAFYEGRTVDELLLVVFRLIALFGLINIKSLHNSTSKSFSYMFNIIFHGGILE
jgi:hypothetical protein